VQVIRKLSCLLCLAPLLGMPGCKREQAKVATIRKPPMILTPATQSVEEVNNERREQLYPRPTLSTGLNGESPDGEHWVKFSNGMMVHDLKPGDGPEPLWGQTVTVNYVGTFPTTKPPAHEFDRSKPGSPLTFTMGGKEVIEGLSIGLMGMHRGGKRRIFIPPDLGYGPRGNVPSMTIPGNQALIFEVELLKVTGEAVVYPDAVTGEPEQMGPPAPGGSPATAATSTAPAP
jgi:FKBP-type peptidyl-prolyl cis-trans isomerase